MPNPSSSSNRTARSSRSGSSRKIDSETARMTPAARSARPSCGSCVSPVRTDTAIALNVKSRVARSASIPVADRREVDRLVDAVRDDPPRSVPLGEREDRPAEAAGEAIRCVAWLRAGDVEVENRSQEELVSHSAADDPCVLVPEDLAESLIHRSRPAGHGPSACSSLSRSRTRSCPRRVRAPRCGFRRRGA